MEAKLKEYRALRRRKELIDNAKGKLDNTKQKIFNLFVPKFLTDMDKEKKDEVLLIENKQPHTTVVPHISSALINDSADIASEDSELESEEEKETEESWKYFIIKWIVYIVTWLTLYIFFLKVGFGAVFFVVSMLIGVCLNTRTKKRKQGEVSAYSVFNQNCESIDGTLKAEDLQRQMVYGVGAVKIF